MSALTELPANWFTEPLRQARCVECNRVLTEDNVGWNSLVRPLRWLTSDENTRLLSAATLLCSQHDLGKNVS